MPLKFLDLDRIKLKILQSINEHYIELLQKTLPPKQEHLFNFFSCRIIPAQLSLDEVRKNHRYELGKFRNSTSGSLGRKRLESFMRQLATVDSVEALVKMIEESESYKYGSNFRKAINSALLNSVEIQLKDGMFTPLLRVMHNFPDAAKDVGGNFFTESLNKLQRAYESAQEQITSLSGSSRYSKTQSQESRPQYEALTDAEEIHLLWQLYRT